MTKKEIYIKGMQCVSCEEQINRALNELKSVKASASFKEEKVIVSFDENLINIVEIERAIKNEGFKIISKNKKGEKSESFDLETIFKYIIIVLGMNFIFVHLFRINIIGRVLEIINYLVSNVPVIDENTSFALLFIIGVLTSFHCVAMCGGINVSQCLAFKDTSKKSPNLMYNLGRVTSYTILGGFVGLIGSVFSISLTGQALLYIIVGVFMILMGLNLFGVNIGRKLLPRMPKGFRNINKSGHGPYVVGLLNGFMPCGPLQSMQIYALSTGSFVEGALSMFFFSIGTVPLMYIFGKIGDFKNPSLAKKFMKVSAILVLIMGAVMTNRGLALMDVGTNGLAKSPSQNAIVSEVTGDEQIIYTDLKARKYPDIVVEKGKKVKWIIDATNETLNGCNNEIIINEYGIDKRLNIGENIIEFTPTETGTYRYSCWMGMIRATITVVE